MFNFFFFNTSYLSEFSNICNCWRNEGRLFYQSLAVVLQNRVLNCPQFRRTFHLKVYICEQCQEGRELTGGRTFILSHQPSYREYLRPIAIVKPRFGLDLPCWQRRLFVNFPCGPRKNKVLCARPVKSSSSMRGLLLRNKLVLGSTRPTI